MLENSKIGKEQSRKYQYVYQRHNINHNSTPVYAHIRSFLMKNQWATRVQFTLCHAAATAMHVAQSATYENICIDILPDSRQPTKWWQHMHCVALSRITSVNGLHIKKTKCEETKNLALCPKVLYYVQKAKVANQSN